MLSMEDVTNGLTPNVLMWIGGSVATTLAASAFILNIHSKFPHEGALLKSHFDQYIKSQEQTIEATRDFRGEIRHDIRQIQTDLARYAIAYSEWREGGFR